MIDNSYCNNSYKYKYKYKHKHKYILTVNKPLSLGYPLRRRGVIDSVIISLGV